MALYVVLALAQAVILFLALAVVLFVVSLLSLVLLWVLTSSVPPALALELVLSAVSLPSEPHCAPGSVAAPGTLRPPRIQLLSCPSLELTWELLQPFQQGLKVLTAASLASEQADSVPAAVLLAAPAPPALSLASVLLQG